MVQNVLDRHGAAVGQVAADFEVDVVGANEGVETSLSLGLDVGDGHRSIHHKMPALRRCLGRIKIQNGMNAIKIGKAIQSSAVSSPNPNNHLPSPAPSIPQNIPAPIEPIMIVQYRTQ